jgi:hypothetical protein
MKNIEELHKLCEKAMESIAESNKKLAKDNERLSAADVTYLDQLAHMVKSIKTVIAMEEYSDDYPEGTSGEGGWNYNRPYYTSGNYYGNSGARRMRDSMGRYTSRDGGYMNGGNYTYSRDNGYSRDASRKKMVSKLETLMDDTMSDSERMAIEECIAKIEK